MRCPCGHNVFARDRVLSVDPSAERWVPMPSECCDDGARYGLWRVRVETGAERLTCQACRRVRRARGLGGGTALRTLVYAGVLYVVVTDVASPDGVFGRFESPERPGTYFDVPARLVDDLDAVSALGKDCVIDFAGVIFATEEGACITLDTTSCEPTEVYLVDEAALQLTTEDGRDIQLEVVECECTPTDVILVDEESDGLTTEAGRVILEEHIPCDEDLEEIAVVDTRSAWFYDQQEQLVIVDERSGGRYVWVLDRYSVIMASEDDELIYIDELPDNEALEPIEVVSDLPAGVRVVRWYYEIPLPKDAPAGDYSVVLHDRFLARLQDLGVVRVGA